MDEKNKFDHNDIIMMRVIIGLMTWKFEVARIVINQILVGQAPSASVGIVAADIVHRITRWRIAGNWTREPLR